MSTHREFSKFVELGGLTHRLEDGFNIIFQYIPPLLQCIWPIIMQKKDTSS